MMYVWRETAPDGKVWDPMYPATVHEALAAIHASLVICSEAKARRVAQHVVAQHVVVVVARSSRRIRWPMR